jgi:hypothetical protein
MIIKQFIFSGFLVNLLVLYSFAAPGPTVIAVNENTKECSSFFTGDECTDCDVPPGWKSLGYAHMIQCPQDYKMVDLDAVCKPRKSFFCCSENHSGAEGQCDDLVIDDVNGKCAFVEDINKCGSLPPGWTSASICPAGFTQQTETVSCEKIQEKGE